MLDKSTRNQYFAAICVNMISVAFGATCGWPSASFLVLQSDASPLGRVSVDQISNIAAILCIGGLIGNLASGWLSDRIGRKVFLLLMALPQVASWLFIIMASSVTHLYISRFLGGFSGGGAFGVIPCYVAEISNDSVRGTLGSIMVLGCTVGTLIAFIAGNYLHYDTIPYVHMLLPIIFALGFIHFPESPGYLRKFGKIEASEKSLQFYRGYKSTGDLNSVDIPQKEDLESLKMNKSQDMADQQSSTTLSWKDFTSRSAAKGLLISVALVFFNQFCGCFAMINYTATIFAESGSSMTPNMSAIIVGIIQCIGAYCATVLVDKAGRKVLIGGSGLGACIGLSTMGGYMALKERGYSMEGFTWVPVTCFSFVIFIASVGILSLAFLVMAELIPEKIRAVSVSLCMALLWSLAFIIVKSFPLVVIHIGMKGAMLIFAACSLLGAFFVFLVMPETKGKSFEVIMEMLEK